MSFNFGSTPGFGATNTTQNAGFGFGTTSTAAKPATGFGTTNFSFGQTSTPSFGLGSNVATTSSAGFGGFGGASTGAFGSPLSTTTGTATGFGGFGTSAPGGGAPATGAAPATGGGLFSGFGTSGGSVSTPASTGFSFGGFGATTPAATTSAPSLFSGFGQQAATGLGAFGTKPFGTTTTQSAGLGSFGLGSGLGQGNLGLGQQPAQQPQHQQTEAEQVHNSVFNCCMFGDERDRVLAKWNLLQACWGTGKGFYNPNQPPVEYKSRNPFYRFKAVVYSVKPTVEARDGFVALQFNKKDQEIRNGQEQLKATINNILGNRPNLVVHVDSVRPISENACLVFIYVEEKAQSGQTKRIPNSELCNYLLQLTQKNQLMGMGVIDAYPFLGPDKDQIQDYLDNPPSGIDATLWRQAQSDNPDSTKYLPVPLLGFEEVRWRHNCQVDEIRRHQVFLDRLAEVVNSLKSQNEESRLKILEFKQKVTDLEHRILKLMVNLQITHNAGISLQPEEELLRSQLDCIQSLLNSPQLSGKLSEILTQARLYKQEASQQEQDAYNMSASVQQEIKQFLAMQQSSIKSLVDIMQLDMHELKRIEVEMNKMSRKP